MKLTIKRKTTKHEFDVWLLFVRDDEMGARLDLKDDLAEHLAGEMNSAFDSRIASFEHWEGTSGDYLSILLTHPEGEDTCHSTKFVDGIDELKAELPGSVVEAIDKLNELDLIRDLTP